MRRIEKKPDSSIITEGLTYKEKQHRSRITDVLRLEQHNICAYTEEWIGRADKAEIEHFDPTLKPTENDSYQNWFLVKGQWNNEKGSIPRWKKYQPLLHPTADDFEERIVYYQGRYILADQNDTEAKNLRSYLKLDDEELDKQRINYIARMRADMALLGFPNQDFIDWRLASPTYYCTIYYVRAIEEEFNVKVNFDLLPTK